MLNFFIFLTFILLMILVGIKYGMLLQVLAILLAILALIPFVMSAYLYFVKSPVIEYQIANKSKKQENGKFVYDFWFGIQCKKGQVLARNLYIAPEWSVTPIRHPDTTYDFQYGPMLEEGGFTATACIKVGSHPLFEKHGLVYVLRFESDTERKQINTKFILDMELDPMKHGFYSVFQPNYKYRYILDIPIDFENLNRQEGKFKK